MIELFSGMAKKFRVHARYNEALDWMEYVERDCTYRTEPVPDSNMVLYIADDGKLVGMRIENFSQVFLIG